MKDFRLGFQFIYKQNKNLTEDTSINGWDPNKLDDLGRPIWLPYTFTDPGWDGTFGTGDDKEMTVYGLASYAPPQSYLGDSPAGCERKYIAGVFTFSKRMSNRWQLSGSVIYSAFKGNANWDYGGAEGETTLYDDPNSLINAYGRIRYDRPLNVKILATYVLPWDISISTYFNYRSGTPWARTLRTITFPPGFGSQWTTVSGVAAEPNGTQRYPTETSLDLRVEKDFNFENLGKLSFYLDVFNAGGSTYLAVQQDPNGDVYFYESPPRYVIDTNYKRINSVTGVRSLRLGIRWSF
jgi:hypothetical protein